MHVVWMVTSVCGQEKELSRPETCKQHQKLTVNETLKALYSNINVLLLV